MLAAGATAVPFGTAGVFVGCDGACVVDSVFTSAGFKAGAEVPFV